MLLRSHLRLRVRLQDVHGFVQEAEDHERLRRNRVRYSTSEHNMIGHITQEIETYTLFFSLMCSSKNHAEMQESKLGQGAMRRRSDSSKKKKFSILSSNHITTSRFLVC